MIEYIFLAGAILLWGSYLVPFRKMKADIRYSQFVMCCGIMITTVVLSVAIGLGTEITVYGVASGIMWGMGNFFSLLAIERIGMSRAFPIWISSMLVAYVWGVALFSEISGIGIALGVAGTLAIISGSVVITKTKKESEKSIAKGVAFALAAALLFGTQFVPFKLSSLPPGDFFFQMSLGIFIASIAIFLSKIKIPDKKQLKEGLLAGVLWGIANLLGIYVVGFFGIAKASSLTQTCVIIGVLWGLLYFREFKGRKTGFRIVTGTLVILAGALLVGIA